VPDFYDKARKNGNFGLCMRGKRLIFRPVQAVCAGMGCGQKRQYLCSHSQKGGIYMLELNYRDARPIYEQIKDGLRRLILSDVIRQDEKLPSVRELASQLAINPNTIQKAYRELEQEGYVYTVSGRGSFAAPLSEVRSGRQELLLAQFDEAVTELLYLKKDPEELKQRIDRLQQGGAQK